jgi:hypothetical protein|tara:strand:- start:821 stop:997 length:177 start_codon:yes stop_codon:yes gene_type:complete
MIERENIVTIGIMWALMGLLAGVFILRKIGFVPGSAEKTQKIFSLESVQEPYKDYEER